MTASAAKWVWANSRASNGSLIVLLAIADECGKDGIAEMKIAEIARKARLSERAVQCALRDLTALGEISVAVKAGAGGRNRYALCMPGGADSAPHPAESAPPPQNLHPAESAPPNRTTPRSAPEGAESAPPEISNVLKSTTGSCKAEVKDVPAKPPRDDERPDVGRLCEHLARRITGNGNRPPKVTQKWRDAARLLIDKDGLTEKQVHDAIDWSQDSEFWRANILSMPKLREKYDTLRQQARRDGKTTGRQNPDDDYAAALKRISERKEAANGTRGNSHDRAPRQIGLPAAADRRHHLRNLAPHHRRA